MTLVKSQRLASHAWPRIRRLPAEEVEDDLSSDYSAEMQSRMGGGLTYRHELGMNFNYILDDLIVGSCPQTAADVDRCMPGSPLDGQCPASCNVELLALTLEVPLASAPSQVPALMTARCSRTLSWTGADPHPGVSSQFPDACRVVSDMLPNVNILLPTHSLTDQQKSRPLHVLRLQVALKGCPDGCPQ